MRLLRLAVISSLLAGCISPPPKPDVDICQLDVPALQGICGLTSQPGVNRREPLAALDKSTCFVPAQWELVQNYIDLMEDYVRNQCKR